MTGLESFANPANIGAMYPFVGSEGFLVIVALAIWVIWHIWQIAFENREYNEAVKLYREVGLKRAMHHGGAARVASEEESKVQAGVHRKLD